MIFIVTPPSQLYFFSSVGRTFIWNQMHICTMNLKFVKPSVSFHKVFRFECISVSVCRISCSLLENVSAWHKSWDDFQSVLFSRAGKRNHCTAQIQSQRYSYESGHFIHPAVMVINGAASGLFSETQTPLSVAPPVRSICKCLPVDCWEVSFAHLLLFLEWMWRRGHSDGDVRDRGQHPAHAAVSEAADGYAEVSAIGCNLPNAWEWTTANSREIRPPCLLLDILHAPLTDHLSPNVCTTFCSTT